MSQSISYDNNLAHGANLLYDTALMNGENGFLGDVGGDGSVFSDLMSAKDSQVANAQQGLKRTREQEKLAAQVTQQSQEDSLKIGLANLLAKAKNMQTQSHLTLAKEAIEVSKSSA